MSHKEEAEMTTIDHQQAARTAVMNSIRQIEPNLYQNPHNPERYYGGLADDMLTAATPHLRAAWEQELTRAVKRLPWNGVTHGGTMVPLDAVLALLEGGGE